VTVETCKAINVVYNVQSKMFLSLIKVVTEVIPKNCLKEGVD